MKFEKKEYINTIISSNIFGFYDLGIKLKSGRIGYYYVNFRNALENPTIFKRIVNYIVDFILDKKLVFDCIYGVPEGATPWAVAVSYELLNRDFPIKVISVGRGKIKEHGDPKNKYFVCAPVENVLILEDVTTTGSSILNEIQKLSELKNIKIVGVLTLLNRCEIRDDNKTVSEILENEKIPFYSLATIHDILPIAINTLKPSESTIRKVWEYYKKFVV